MMNRAEEFLNIFSEVEQYLRKKVQDDRYMDFPSLLVGSQNDRVIKQFTPELRDYASLRNAIIHRGTNKPIAEPYQETIDKFRSILKILNAPPLAMSIASNPVTSCAASDLISEVINKMAANNFTHIPAYDKNMFIGVLSESSLLKWLASNTENGGTLLAQTTIKDIQSFLDQSDDNLSSYTFKARGTSALEFADLFEEFISQERRLGAIFITEHGTPSEKILGIVTAWDIYKLNEILQ